MDPLTITLITVAAAALVGLSWMSGYDIGKAAGVDGERNLANRRVKGVLGSVAEIVAHENNRKTRRRTNRRASK